MTTPQDRLAARLNRADSNLSTLEQSLGEFMAEDKAYRVDAHQDVFAIPDQLFVCVTLLREPPLLTWANMIGDVVHNYRATLDNLVWELSTVYSGSPPPDPIPTGDPWRQLGFPIVLNSDRWNPTKPSSPLWAVDPLLIPKFAKYQPFVTGPHAPERQALAVLQELWNIDKHRHIPIVILAVRAEPGGSFAMPAIQGQAIANIYAKRELKLNTPIELFSVDVLSDVPQRVDVDWRISMEIGFGNGPPAHGWGTVGFFHEVHKTVTAIVAEFEAELS